MTEHPEYSAVGGDLVQFKPTAELRFELRWLPTKMAMISEQQPVLQQKWVASKEYGEITYTDEHWRDVPFVVAPPQS